MPVLTATPIDIPWLSSFNPAPLRNRLCRNRVKGKTHAAVEIHTVALIPVLKLHWLQIAVCHIAHDRIWHAVNAILSSIVAAEIRMQLARAAIVNESDEIIRIYINGPVADIAIPPVVRWKQWQRLRQCPTP